MCTILGCNDSVTILGCTYSGQLFYSPDSHTIAIIVTWDAWNATAKCVPNIVADFEGRIDFRISHMIK